MSIKGVKFEGGLIGMNKVQIQWRDFTDYVKVEMAAGPPVKLQLLNWNLDQVMRNCIHIYSVTIY